MKKLANLLDKIEILIKRYKAILITFFCCWSLLLVSDIEDHLEYISSNSNDIYWVKYPLDQIKDSLDGIEDGIKCLKNDYC